MGQEGLKNGWDIKSGGQDRGVPGNGGKVLDTG